MALEVVEEVVGEVCAGVWQDVALTLRALEQKLLPRVSVVGSVRVGVWMRHLRRWRLYGKIALILQRNCSQEQQQQEEAEEFIHHHKHQYP